MRTYRTVDFAVPADLRVKITKGEKGDKNLYFAKEPKKLLNMKVTVIPVVIGAFCTIPEGLVKGQEDSEIRDVETIQSTALLRSARILRRVLETRGDLLSFRLLWNTIT